MDDEYDLDLDEFDSLDELEDSDELDELSDEERDAYEMGYHTGFGAGGGWN